VVSSQVTNIIEACFQSRTVRRPSLKYFTRVVFELAGRGAALDGLKFLLREIKGVAAIDG